MRAVVFLIRWCVCLDQHTDVLRSVRDLFRNRGGAFSKSWIPAGMILAERLMSARDVRHSESFAQMLVMPPVKGITSTSSPLLAAGACGGRMMSASARAIVANIELSWREKANAVLPSSESVARR